MVAIVYSFEQRSGDRKSLSLKGNWIAINFFPVSGQN